MDFSCTQNSVHYYGVYIPPENPLVDAEKEVLFAHLHVYTDRSEALKVVKRSKKARFKVFASRADAEDFSCHGSEQANPSPDGETSVLMGEKVSQFRGPKAQELVKLRKAIENGDVDLVTNTVWDNPRYLVSSGDTPSILQEGSRYNALHVAAKAMNHKMCELILDTVSSVEFVQLLYGDDNLENCQDRANILLDLYLNTPDKGLNETPLHFAVKFGAVHCVEVLTSYPECDKTVKNKFHSAPRDMICQRCDKVDGSLKKRILSLLEDPFYVPVLRSQDLSVMPVVGKPFTPSSPPTLNADPISPRIEIRAYAGPMKIHEATDFCKKWKTPPRMLQSPRKTPGSTNIVESPNSPSSVYRLLDTDKGLERVGRDLAHEYHIGWKEYWPFLDTFVDLSSTDGLNLLEEYIGKKFNDTVQRLCATASSGSSNLSAKLLLSPAKRTAADSDTELEIEIKDIISPISELCLAFKGCSLKDNGSTLANVKSVGCIGSSSNNCNINAVALAASAAAATNNNSDSFFSANPSISPFMCVEKSLQVFQTRIFNTVLNLPSENSESIKFEIRHLLALICSYMIDERFVAVDFHAVHSRVAKAVGDRINEEATMDECNNLSQLLTAIVESKRLEETIRCNEPRSNTWTFPFLNQHVICVTQKIVDAIQNSTDHAQFVIPDLYNEEACRSSWQATPVCTCSWEGNMPKRHTRKTAAMNRNNMMKMVTIAQSNVNVDSPLVESVSRRLFDSKPDDLCTDDSDDSSDESECFYTPPTSPIHSVTSDSDEEMVDVSDVGNSDVYLEGPKPTKLDAAVYEAIRNVPMTDTEFPHIYRWKHAIQLYTDRQRDKWPRSNLLRNPITSTPQTSTGTGVATTPPAEGHNNVSSTGRMSPSGIKSPPAWVRVTGVNSPRRSESSFLARRRVKVDACDSETKHHL